MGVVSETVGLVCKRSNSVATIAFSCHECFQLLRIDQSLEKIMKSLCNPLFRVQLQIPIIYYIFHMRLVS